MAKWLYLLAIILMMFALFGRDHSQDFVPVSTKIVENVRKRAAEPGTEVGATGMLGAIMHGKEEPLIGADGKPLSFPTEATGPGTEALQDAPLPDAATLSATPAMPSVQGISPPMVVPPSAASAGGVPTPDWRNSSLGMPRNAQNGTQRAVSPPSATAPATAPGVPEFYLRSGQRVYFSGERVYTTGTGGDLFPLPDGEYYMRTGELLTVRGGKRYTQ